MSESPPSAAPSQTAAGPTSDYVVEDRELLMGIYRKILFDPILARIPDRVVPNWITVFGVTCSLLAVAAATTASTFPALLLVASLLLLTYLTADNVDGPHARRTGQTSDIGELLDHGLDGIASGAIVLTATIILDVQGIWLALVALLGAIGFAIPFWEQLRRGVLVIPSVSNTEGITAVVGLGVVAYATGRPPWLHFDAVQPNIAVAVIVCIAIGYLVVIVSTIGRVAVGGHTPLELLWPLAIASAMPLYVVAGADALLPAIMVSVFGADLVCRTILVRHQMPSKLMSWVDCAPIVPLIPAWLLSDPAISDACAGLATAAAVARYARSMVTGIRHLRKQP